MRFLLCILAFTLATPAVAELRPDGTTALSGLGLRQNGAPVPFQPEGEAYVATLAPGGFVLTFPAPSPEGVALTFGPDGLFDLLDLAPETGLFGPGMAYARYEGPTAAHYMTDPLCANASYGPGFNQLDMTRATAEGYPVAALHVDAASRGCEARGRWPQDTDLLGRISPLHVVVRTDAGIERLILQYAGS